MNYRIIAFVATVLLFTWSCGNKTGVRDSKNDGNAVVQGDDGSLTLNLEKAACYSDKDNPASNTAEWNVRIAKPGRFKVWLTSATKDTTTLNYINAVKINLLDSFLEASPTCDKIIRNSSEISYPYYRADSYMGTFYVSEPGVYNIQVISEKILPNEAMNQVRDMSGDTRLLSVLLTPMTR